jgi:CPA2 family monovalent cation:H+ antiporter-2
LFTNLLFILTASLAVISIFHRIGLPPILGYLCVGLLCGPSAFGWINNFSTDQPYLSEMGVVFLLFTLGLEFSLPRMLAMRNLVFGLGSLQVLSCALVLTGILYAFGIDLLLAAILGSGLALSSTAIVSKELFSLGEIFSPHGRNAIAVLIFQDLVAVLLLTLLPVAAGQSDEAWYIALPMTLGKTVLLFAVLRITSRWFLPKLFHEVARARSPELFVLLALVIVMLTAWVTHALGLSMALGAFLAGMLLGESHYRHQIEADIRPFRDILLGLFFVSVGMLIDLRLFASDGLLILGLTLLLLCLKGGLVAALVKLRGDSTETAWRTAFALAQGGEFFFALLSQLVLYKLLDAETVSVLLTVTFCSMLLTPLLLRGAPALAARMRAKEQKPSATEEIAAAGAALQQHVLICGYGRVGQSIGRFLRLEGIPFLALDDDPVRVQEAVAGEESAHYGDSQRPDMLQAMNIAAASLLVVAVDKTDAALHIVTNARRLNARIPILVRLRDDRRLAELQAAGATEVIPETLESSMMLAAHAMLLLGMPKEQIETRLYEARSSRYRLLHGFYHGAQTTTQDNQGKPRTLLHAVSLPADAHACGKVLQMDELTSLGLEVQGVRRDGEEMSPFDSILQEGDAILISGRADAIEAGEARLLAGN